MIGEADELSWGYIEFDASEEHTAASFMCGCRARGRRLGWVFGTSDVWEPLETDGSPKHGVDKITQQQLCESDVVSNSQMTRRDQRGCVACPSSHS